jgi:hypothetical protein
LGPVALAYAELEAEHTARRVRGSGELVEGGGANAIKTGIARSVAQRSKNVTLAAPLRKGHKNRAATAIKPPNSWGQTQFRSDDNGAGFEMFGAITCAKKPPLACILSPVTVWLMQVSRDLLGLVAGARGCSVPRVSTAGAVLETTACHLPADFDLFGLHLYRR